MDSEEIKIKKRQLFEKRTAIETLIEASTCEVDRQE